MNFDSIKKFFSKISPMSWAVNFLLTRAKLSEYTLKQKYSTVLRIGGLFGCILTLLSFYSLQRFENNIEIEIDVTNGPPGLVVDGQQRLTALAEVVDKKFEVFVSILICEDEEGLKRQFILIHKTNPLSKSLIYELLPGVSKRPERMSAKAHASKLTNNVNYDESSSLY